MALWFQLTQTCEDIDINNAAVSLITATSTHAAHWPTKDLMPDQAATDLPPRACGIVTGFDG